MIDWNMFGAGAALIGFTVLLLMLSGILATFRVKVRVPWFIPTIIFIIGILLVMQSVGMITDLNKLLMYAVMESNLPEFVLGVVLVLFAIYKSLYAKLGIEPSGWIRLSMLIFGVILVLDSLRILPILYYFSQIIAYATQTVVNYLVLYPWLSVFVVIGVFMAITLLYFKVTKKGGVKA